MTRWGGDGPRAAAAARRRDGARRRLRLGPGHRAAGRGAAARPGDRPRRLACDARRGASAPGSVRRPGRVRRGRPAPAAADRTSRSTRSSRRPPSTGSPTTPPCSPTWPRSCGRAAGWWPSAAAPATSPRSEAILATLGDGWPGPWTFATPAETEAAPAGGRLRRGRSVAPTRTDAARARAGRSRPTCARSSWATTSPGCPRPSATAFVRAVAARLPGAGDRLRPAEHHRPAGRLTAALSWPSGCGSSPSSRPGGPSAA